MVYAENYNTYEYTGLIIKGQAKNALKYTAYNKEGYLT